jgi:hypothetical protein
MKYLKYFEKMTTDYFKDYFLYQYNPHYYGICEVSVSLSSLKNDNILYMSDNMDELVEKFEDMIELKNNINKFNL